MMGSLAGARCLAPNTGHVHRAPTMPKFLIVGALGRTSMFERTGSPAITIQGAAQSLISKIMHKRQQILEILPHPDLEKELGGFFEIIRDSHF